MLMCSPPPEIHVPPHSNYTESVYLVSEDEVLLNTNLTCQLSEVKQDLSQDLLGLPLPWGVPESPTYHVLKARQTRVTQSKRKPLMSAHKAECVDQAITKTEDFPISEEDHKTMREGGLVKVTKEARTRGCIEHYQCTGVGPHACGYTGWTNPVTNQSFTFHQVILGSNNNKKRPGEYWQHLCDLQRGHPRPF